MKKNKSIVMMITLAIVTATFSQGFGQINSTETRLQIGQPAPDFMPAYWLKGGAVDHFQKGKAYVVEFWATWCVYCIKSMPRLAELSTQYQGKVEFIGVDVHETTPWKQDAIVYQKPILEKFVTVGPGKAMNYHICVDTKDEYLWNYWVTGQHLYTAGIGVGIPFGVIIDKAGNIAWVGNPYENPEFESALSQVVEGTYDLEKFKVLTAERKAASLDYLRKETDKRASLATCNELDGFKKAYADKDYATALQSVYAAIDNNPKLASVTFVQRGEYFNALFASGHADEAHALMQLEQNRIDKMQDSSKIFWHELTAKIGKVPHLDKKYYKLVIEDLKERAFLRATSPRLPIGLAYAYYYTGDKTKAVEIIAKLSETAKQNGSDPSLYEKTLADLK